MGLLGIVTSLLRALAAYWELKAKRYEHDCYTEAQEQVYEYEDQIESLRNSGTHADTLLADRMRHRLKAAKRYAEHLSGTDPETTGRDAGADD